MRCQRLSRLYLLLIGPLTFLVLSACLTWTQERPSASETPTQSSSLAAQFAAVPEANIRSHPVNETLSLPFAPNQGQTPYLRFRSLDIGYHLPPIKNNALPGLWQLAKTDELQQAKANHFIDNTPIEWLTDVSTHDKVYFRTRDPARDLAYYGHQIPWAGRIILGIGKQAQFHPRVTRVIELIGPGLTFENRLPRGSVSNIHAIGRGQLP